MLVPGCELRARKTVLRVAGLALLLLLLLCAAALPPSSGNSSGRQLLAQHRSAWGTHQAQHKRAASKTDHAGRPFEEYPGDDSWKANVVAAAASMRAYLNQTHAPHRPPSGSRARGVVIPAGGAVLLANAFVVASLLRVEHGCKLPVAVMYNGAREVDNGTIAYFQERFVDVTFTDVTTLPYPPHHRHIHLDHFAFKAYCLYQAPFHEVLLLDADSLPLRPTDPLFDTRQWRHAGNLFWPDFWLAGDSGISVESYELFGLPPPWPRNDSQWLQSTEAGQLLFDRRRHADVLEWYWFLNSHGPKGLYQPTGLIWGDKDTMQLAFSLAGKAGLFRQVRHYPRDGLCKSEITQRGYAHLGQLHSDPDGLPAFLHQAGSLRKLDVAATDVCRLSHATLPLSEEAAQWLVPTRAGAPADIWELGFAHEQVTEMNAEQCAAATQAAGGKGGSSWVPGDPDGPDTAPGSQPAGGQQHATTSPALFGTASSGGARQLREWPAAAREGQADDDGDGRGLRSDDNRIECGKKVFSRMPPFPVVPIDDFSATAAAAARAAYLAFDRLKADAEAGRVLALPCKEYNLDTGVVCGE